MTLDQDVPPAPPAPGLLRPPGTPDVGAGDQGRVSGPQNYQQDQ